MTNRLWLFSAWALLIGGALLISILGNVVATSLPANRWLHFLVYAAVTSVPCGVWRTKRAVAMGLLIVGCSVMCGAGVAIGHWNGARAESTVSDFFGIAAGVLLGLNIRFSRNQSKDGQVADAKQKTEPSRPLREVLERTYQ